MYKRHSYIYLFIIALKRINVGFIVYKIKLNNLTTVIANFDKLSEYPVDILILSKTHNLDQF